MRKFSRGSKVAAALVVSLCGAGVAAALLSVTAPVLVSVSYVNSSDGQNSHVPRLSPNANLMVFASFRSDLVPNDGNEQEDVFLRSPSGSLSRVNVPNSDVGASETTGGFSGFPSISQTVEIPSVTSNAYAIAFMSRAHNLVSEIETADTIYDQVYVRLPYLNKTVLVSRAVNPTQFAVAGNENSKQPSVSFRDGEFIVAFSSRASNLVEFGGGGGSPSTAQWRIYFAHIDPKTGSVNKIVPYDRDFNVIPNGHLEAPVLNGQGDLLVFESLATNIPGVEGITGIRQIVAQKKGSPPFLVSKSAEGAPGGIDSFKPSVSFDGSKIVFTTLAGGLFGKNTTAQKYAALWEKDTSGSASLTQLNDVTSGLADADGVGIDPKGEFVIFMETNSTLVSDDTNGARDVFVKSLASGEIVRINMTAAGDQETDGSRLDPAIGGLGFSSRVLTLGFVSSGSVLDPQNELPEQQVYRSTLTQPIPEVEAGAPISTPPDVKTRPKTIYLTLQQFSVSSDSTLGASGDVNASADWVKYEVRLSRTSTKKVTRITSSRNRVTLRNVSPGKYTVRYRVSSKSGNTTKTTKYSPSVSVTVRKS